MLDPGISDRDALARVERVKAIKSITPVLLTFYPQAQLKATERAWPVYCRGMYVGLLGVISRQETVGAYSTCLHELSGKCIGRPG